MKFFSHLFLLVRATEAEVTKQAEERVQNIIEKIEMKKKLNEELKRQTEKICEDISKEKDKEIEKIEGIKSQAKYIIDGQVENTKSFMTKEKNVIEAVSINSQSDIKELIKKSRNDLDKIKENLKNKVNLAIIFLTVLTGILGGPSLITSFLSINTSKIEIEYLKSDIEDLQDEIKILRGN